MPCERLAIAMLTIPGGKKILLIHVLQLAVANIHVLQLAVAILLKHAVANIREKAGASLN